MGEDAGKKKFIRDFLQRIKPGDGFYDDMRIERVVRTPGSDGGGSVARSSSGKPVNTITQLLEDDLRHTFDNGFFTFRLVNAHLGSGKTTLLLYLHELAKTKQAYGNFSVFSFFRLSEIQSIGGNQGFSIKFYSYILGQTFWELVNNSNPTIRNKAKDILNDYLEPTEINNLLGITTCLPFCTKFRKYFSESGIVFEEFFFEVINRISETEPRFTFAYLIDDLDHLKDFPDDFQETRSLIKSLVRRAYQKFNSKIRLLIYLAGTSDNVMKFIDDPVIESLVGHLVIVLSKGSGDEFKQIKNKIDQRIQGAFKGYKGFDEAWQSIKDIKIDPAQNLRTFYQTYVTALLEIYEKYFKEEPEKRFEGNARDLVEAKCKQKWQSYLNQKSYTLSSVSTTTILAEHAFDCYVELLHNGTCVARAFGEAKNYELLSSHLDIFNQWLEDVKFKCASTNGTPCDLAFMIAPACPSLLQRKLELKNICFIQVDKVDPPPIISPDLSTQSVNLKIADKESIVHALKGTGIRGTTIDKLMKLRNNRAYKNLDDLISALKLNPNITQKLRTKVEDKKICFF